MKPSGSTIRGVLAARALHAELGADGKLPFDPIGVAERLDIVVQGSDQLGQSFSGCLLREGGSFGILYSTSVPNEGFRRFTVAHELGHFRMPHHHGPLFANERAHYSTTDFGSGLWHEMEADRFAAEFLMPEDTFREAMRPHRIGLPAIRALAEMFLTSLTSTAIRYATLTPDPVIVIVSKDGGVLFSFASQCLVDRGIGLIRAGSPIPRASETARFIRSARGPRNLGQAEGRVGLDLWAERSPSLLFCEDVVGLGSTGRVLTVLHAGTLPDDEDEGVVDDHFNPDGKRYRW